MHNTAFTETLEIIKLVFGLGRDKVKGLICIVGARTGVVEAANSNHIINVPFGAVRAECYIFWFV